ALGTVRAGRRRHRLGLDAARHGPLLEEWRRRSRSQSGTRLDGFRAGQGIHASQRQCVGRGAHRRRGSSTGGPRDGRAIGSRIYRRLMHPFDVLADPVRRRLLELLAEGERSSGDLTVVVRSEFGITQSAVSQHLKVLRDTGFATVRVDRSRRVYVLQGAALRDVDVWLERFRVFWAPKLEALATEVARGKRERRRSPKAQEDGDSRTASPAASRRRRAS